MMKGRGLSSGLLALLLVLLGRANVWGQLLTNSPRALGMGNAYIAVSDDEGAIVANPAGLALTRKGIFAVGSLGLTNTQDHWYGAYVIPSSSSAIQGSAFSFAHTDNNVTNVRTDRISWTAGQYYAEGVAVGMSLNFLRGSDDTAGTNDKAFGVDLGVIYQIPALPGGRSLGTVGVLVQNPNEPRLLGAKLPRVVSVGVSTRLMPGLLLAADSYNVLDEADAAQEQSVGLELTPAKGIALRGGFMNKAEVFTLGAGIRGQAFHLDAAWASKDGGQKTSFVGMGFLF